MRKRSELFFSMLLVPLDCIALVGAFVVAYIIRVHIQQNVVAHPISAFGFLGILLIALPVWVIIFALVGLYNQSNTRGRLSELGRIFVAVSGSVMAIILLDFISVQPIFPSKSVPIYAYGLGLVFVTLARSIMRSIQVFCFRFGIGLHKVLIVGSGELTESIYTSLNNRKSGFQVVGILDTTKGANTALDGIAYCTDLNEAYSLIAANNIDQIIQADSELDQDEVLGLVDYASNKQISYKFVPNQFGMYATNSSFSEIAGIPILEIRLTPLDGWGRIIKRIFDVIGATFGLILLSPLLIIVALTIKIADPGPIFFKHKRLTRTGKEFYVYKFRSMRYKFTSEKKYKGKSPEEVFKILGRDDLVEEFKLSQKVQNDPRVYPFGSFMRRTSIDELPQLINAWFGDLSLVGPRPIIPKEILRYGDQKASLMSLKPGITGLWQVSGRSDLGYEERVKLDIYYVENWSLWLDIKILIRTIRVIFSNNGAY